MLGISDTLKKQMKQRVRNRFTFFVRHNNQEYRIDEVNSSNLVNNNPYGSVISDDVDVTVNSSSLTVSKGDLITLGIVYGTGDEQLKEDIKSYYVYDFKKKSSYIKLELVDYISFNRDKLVKPYTGYNIKLSDLIKFSTGLPVTGFINDPLLKRCIINNTKTLGNLLDDGAVAFNGLLTCSKNTFKVLPYKLIRGNAVLDLLENQVMSTELNEENVANETPSYTTLRDGTPEVLHTISDITIEGKTMYKTDAITLDGIISSIRIKGVSDLNKIEYTSNGVVLYIENTSSATDKPIITILGNNLKVSTEVSGDSTDSNSSTSNQFMQDKSVKYDFNMPSQVVKLENKGTFWLECGDIVKVQFKDDSILYDGYGIVVNNEFTFSSSSLKGVTEVLLFERSEVNGIQ